MDRYGRALPAHILPTGYTHYAHRQPVSVRYVSVEKHRQGGV